MLAAVSPAAAAEPLLPDLTQATPYQLGVITDGTRSHLGFASVVHNYGDGPLHVEGARPNARQNFMVATQIIDMTEGPHTRVERVGRMRFVDAVTHRHWHYQRFSTYSLRRPDGRVAVPDRKSGFCLGDRLESPNLGPLPNRAEFGEYGDSNCGYDRPDLLRVREGISVGYGDDYAPQVEGQYLDLTRVPAGRYVLVHHANADRAIREKSLANNASSVLIDLRWRGRTPRVTIVERCRGSSVCPVVPRLSDGRARSLARAALRRAYRGRAIGSITCTGGSCSTTVDGRAATVAVRYRSARGRLYWTWSARGEALPARRGKVSVSLGAKRRVPVERGGFPPRGQAVKAAARAGYCQLPVSGSG